MNLFKIILPLLFLSATVHVNAQEALTASGGDASGIGGSSSYGIGQVFHSNYIGLNGSEAQGVQHSDETGCIGSAGCKDTSACNYDPAAKRPDGSCEYESCLSFMYPMACNYNSTATIDDESCDFTSCLGEAYTLIDPIT